MSNEKTVRGYIDCPTCGTVGGMRITNDKNGHPFGFCTATCRQQLRVGPDAERVAKFRQRYPFAAATEAAAPVTAPAPAPAAAKAKAAGPWPWRDEPAPAPAPARKRSGLADAVAFLGGQA